MAPKFSKNGKRLGRPPKNPEAVTFNINTTIGSPQEVAPAVPAEPVAPVVQFDPDTMIECEFVDMPQHVLINIPNSPTKSGFYTACNYKLDDRDFDKWPVLAYLKANFDKHRASEMPDREILTRCINYLNALDLKKKAGKKDLEPKYGKLSLAKEDIKFTKKMGYECAILIFCTDQRKSEHFWGEGERA
jgi:hypothetical protein